MSNWSKLGLVVLLAALLMVSVSSLADDDHYAYVENQRSDIVILKYSQQTDTNSSTSILELHPGETKRFDVNTLVGEVCAGVEDDPNPAKILGCKTLTAGQRWVIQ